MFFKSKKQVNKNLWLLLLISGVIGLIFLARFNTYGRYQAAFNVIKDVVTPTMNVSFCSQCPGQATILYPGQTGILATFSLYNKNPNDKTNISIIVQQMIVSASTGITSNDLSSIKLVDRMTQKDISKTVELDSKGRAIFSEGYEYPQNGFVIKAGDTRLVDVVGTVKTSSLSNQLAVGILSANDLRLKAASGSVYLSIQPYKTGSFPVWGNTVTIYQGGSMNVDYSYSNPASANVKAGQKNVYFTGLRFQPTIEDIKINKLTITRTGNSNDSDLDGPITLFALNGEFSALKSLLSNGKAEFVLDRVVKVGSFLDIGLEATIASDETIAGHTIALGIEKAEDISLTGMTSNKNMVAQGSFPLSGSMMTVIIPTPLMAAIDPNTPKGETIQTARLGEYKIKFTTFNFTAGLDPLEIYFLSVRVKEYNHTLGLVQLIDEDTGEEMTDWKTVYSDGIVNIWLDPGSLKIYKNSTRRVSVIGYMNDVKNYDEISIGIQSADDISVSNQGGDEPIMATGNFPLWGNEFEIEI